MANIAVRCTLRSANNSPRDDAMNTFAASGATPGTDDDLLAACFAAFYTTLPAGGTEVLGAYINDTIVRTDGLLVELIDSPQTVPNPAYYSETFNLPGANDNPLPQEVAVCLSFVASDYLTTPNPGRHRGRIYLGPLTTDASSDTGVATPVVPSTGVKNALGSAAEQLLNDCTANGTPWCIWSRAANAWYPVSSGWIDNEFDTQRRRGRVATTKAYWGL